MGCRGIEKSGAHESKDTAVGSRGSKEKEENEKGKSQSIKNLAILARASKSREREA